MALEDIRILDSSQVLAAPFATMLLADMGADVVKIEPPTHEPRQMGPRLSGEDGAGFLALNRNKRSVVIDLKRSEGRDVLLQMVRHADVFVENNRPGVAARLGIDWPTLRQVNPRLVYASVSGFGQTGPYAERPGYDIIAQGMSGIMSVTGEPEGPPVKCGLAISDLGAGLFCANAILVALHARTRTGEGQHIDISLFESALAMSVWESTELWATGNVPRRLGSAHRASAPYQALRAADGYLTVGINNDKFWREFCRIIARPDLIDDDRFSTNRARVSHRDALIAEIEASLAARSADEWLAEFLGAGLPAGPLNDYAAALADPQTEAREMVARLDHPVEGTVRTLGIPTKMSGTPGTLRTAAPLLGQHTSEVLREFGIGEDELLQLVANGSVATQESLRRDMRVLPDAGPVASPIPSTIVDP